MNFTIICMPAPWVGVQLIRQTNALESWTRLRPTPEIILFGDDKGIADAASKYGCRHFSVATNKWGMPIIRDALQIAHCESNNKIQVLINVDIITGSGLSWAIGSVVSEYPTEQFLMAGQRWDMNINDYVDFDNKKWEKNLLSQARTKGKLRRPGAIDYFVFRSPLKIVERMPPLCIGGAGWDNWMCSAALEDGLITIDSTQVVNIFHHDMPPPSGPPSGGTPPARKVNAHKTNREMYFKHKGPLSGGVNQFKYKLTNGGVVRR